MVTARLIVRVAEDADLPALDRALPTGRNDVHRGFPARQASGEVSYLAAGRGGAAVGVGAVRWTGSHTCYDDAGVEHVETERARVLTLAPE